MRTTRLSWPHLTVAALFLSGSVASLCACDSPSAPAEPSNRVEAPRQVAATEPLPAPPDPQTAPPAAREPLRVEVTITPWTRLSGAEPDGERPVTLWEAGLDPRGEHVVAIRRQGSMLEPELDRCWVSHDRTWYGPYAECVSPRSWFSRDGAHAGWIAALDDGDGTRRWSAYVNGVAVGTHELVSASSLTFGGEHGERVAYVICDEPCAAGRDARRWRVVIDGVAGPAHAGVDDIVFSPDGAQVAYWVNLGPDDLHLVRDGRVEGPWDWALPLSFAPDGRLATAVRAGPGGPWRVLVDGEPVGGDWDDVTTPVWSLVGSLVFAGQRDGDWHIVIDGQPHGRWDTLSGAVFSPDGARVGHVARRGDEVFAVIDGEPGPAWSEVFSLVLGPDGHVIHGAVESGAPDSDPFYVHDEHRLRSHSAMGSGAPVFDASGERVAYAALDDDEERAVFVDGQALGGTWSGLDAETLAMSPDGRHVAWGSVEWVGPERRRALIETNATPVWTMVFDGVAAEPIEGELVSGSLFYDGEGRWHFVMRAGHELLRVDVRLVGGDRASD